MKTNLLIALVLVVAILATCTMVVDTANSKETIQLREEITELGPTYILPRKPKTRRILRWTCHYAGSKLYCGPGIGQWFKKIK